MAPTSVKRGVKRNNAQVSKNDKKVSAKLQEQEEVDEVSSSASEDDELDDKISEDELDELDSDEELSTQDGADTDNEDQQDGDESEEPADKKQKVEGGKTSREQHAEQRKLLKERKMKRNGGVEIQRIKSLWEKLRVRNPPIAKPVRDKLCDEIWELSKDCIKDLVLKHDASRVVQTLVKYSSKDRRLAIVKELKDYYFDLARSAYGKYLLIKLLHYGTKESRTIIVDELHGKLRKLLRHREGAYVAEDLFVLYSSAQQKQQMIREFWGAKYAVFKDAVKEGETINDVVSGNEDARNLIAGNLYQTITAAVEKGSTGFQLLHAVMKEYVQVANDKEFGDLIELLQDQVAELVHTPDGCEVACTLIAKASAKQRKVIIKNLKPHAKALATNEHGNLVLLTIFLTVDDTVLVHKSFGSEYPAEEMADLVSSKFGRRPFLYLLCGLDGKYFNPFIIKTLDRFVEQSKNTSKKPQDTRRGELLNKFTPTIYDAIIKFNGKIFDENIGLQFANEAMIHAAKDEKLEAQRTEAITSIISALKGDISNDSHFINKQFASRFLKSLIQGGQWSFKNQVVEKDNDSQLGKPFAHRVINEVINNEEAGENDLSKWIHSKNASFIIASLYESLKNEDDKESKNFVKAVGKFKKILKNADEANKGAKFLLKLVEGK